MSTLLSSVRLQDRGQPLFVERVLELLELRDDLVLFRLEHQVQAAQDDERQDHIPVLVRLERAAQDVVRYLLDEVRFFSEVVWSHEEVPVV